MYILPVQFAIASFLAMTAGENVGIYRYFQSILIPDSILLTLLTQQYKDTKSPPYLPFLPAIYSPLYQQL
jgi:hypothetical protein